MGSCSSSSSCSSASSSSSSSSASSSASSSGDIQSHLGDFCRICGAAEVVLFESTTFLVSHACVMPRARHVRCFWPAPAPTCPCVAARATDAMRHGHAKAHAHAHARRRHHHHHHHYSHAYASAHQVIAHATLSEHADVHRFEKISNIIKQFKLSCRKAQAQFEGMTVRRRRHTTSYHIIPCHTMSHHASRRPSSRA